MPGGTVRARVTGADLVCSGSGRDISDWRVLEDNLRKDREVAQIQRDNFRKAHRAGVKMVFGSDAGVMPHGQVGRQFATMVEYGMTPMEAIQAATRNAAQALGRERDVGAIAAGRRSAPSGPPGRCRGGERGQGRRRG